MNKLEKILSKWNFKKIAAWYLILAVVAGLACVGTVGFIYRERLNSNKKRVIVFGSGPIRIGQGIEFDYCSVHCVRTLKKLGYEAIIANNNPETVSTDFDTSDRLYFDPLTPEDVDSVLETEQPEAVVVQFGGQKRGSVSWALRPTASTRPRTGSASTSYWSSAASPVRRVPRCSPPRRPSGSPTGSAIRCCSVRPMCWAART